MIHKTAIIEPSAKIGNNVKIGAYSYIGADVEIGDDTIIESHVVVKGPSKIGKGNHIFQFASVGEGCQDKKYKNEPTTLTIGDNNVIRECATIHRGTIQDIGTTTIGSGNLFMAYTHIAHDCVVGDNNIMANSASIAGHVHLGDNIILAGFAGIHQFVHVGSHSFCSIRAGVTMDVPPYVMVSPAGKPNGINSEGLKRRGYSSEAITEIKRAYKTIYRSGNSKLEAIEALSDVAEQFAEVKLLKDFIENSSRGIIR